MSRDVDVLGCAADCFLNLLAWLFLLRIKYHIRIKSISALRLATIFQLRGINAAGGMIIEAGRLCFPSHQMGGREIRKGR
jgi:hypothetical protein